MFETHFETIRVRGNHSQGWICNLLNCAIQQRRHGFVKFCPPCFFCKICPDQHKHGASWDSQPHVWNLAKGLNMAWGDWHQDTSWHQGNPWGSSSSQNCGATWHQQENWTRKARQSKKCAPENPVSNFMCADLANLCILLNALLKEWFAAFDPQNMVSR